MDLGNLFVAKWRVYCRAKVNIGRLHKHTLNGKLWKQLLKTCLPALSVNYEYLWNTVYFYDSPSSKVNGEVFSRLEEKRCNPGVVRSRSEYFMFFLFHVRNRDLPISIS